MDRSGLLLDTKITQRKQKLHNKFFSFFTKDKNKPCPKIKTFQFKKLYMYTHQMCCNVLSTVISSCSPTTWTAQCPTDCSQRVKTSSLSPPASLRRGRSRSRSRSRRWWPPGCSGGRQEWRARAAVPGGDTVWSDYKNTSSKLQALSSRSNLQTPAPASSP